MTIAELRRSLAAAGVRRTAYRIHGQRDEAYCLVREADGWTVFAVERGQRLDVQRHAEASDAAHDLLGRVLRDPSTRWMPG